MIDPDKPLRIYKAIARALLYSPHGQNEPAAAMEHTHLRKQTKSKAKASIAVGPEYCIAISGEVYMAQQCCWHCLKL